MHLETGGQANLIYFKEQRIGSALFCLFLENKINNLFIGGFGLDRKQEVNLKKYILSLKQSTIFLEG
jgi:hypothetical protein